MVTSSTARRNRYAERAREVEAISLTRRHPDEADAIARFGRLADPARQMQLAREIVVTRAAELTLAYRNLIMVTVGYRSRSDPRGTPYVYAEPCIIFVVRHKWRTPDRGIQEQLLPKHLLTYGDSDGQRTLFAVPTDVQPASWFLGAVARTASAVNVHDPDHPAPGTMTCGVQLRGAALDENVALSALHVLSPVPDINQVVPRSNLTFTPVGSAAPVGRSAPWGGVLRGSGVSFDAQLAVIDDKAWIGSAFAGLALSATRPYLPTAAAFDAMAATNRFQIVAPGNHPRHLGSPRDPMLAQFVAFAYDELPILYPIRVRALETMAPVRHRELLLLRVLEDCPPPEPGDSGSAVITWWPDGTAVLVGMFIASPDDKATARLAYVLPAWQLFNPVNWEALPPGTHAMTPAFAPV